MADAHTPHLVAPRRHKTALRAGVKKASGVYRSGGQQKNGRDNQRLSRPPAHRSDEPHRAIPWTAALQQSILRFTRCRYSKTMRRRPSNATGPAIAELDKPGVKV